MGRVTKGRVGGVGVTKRESGVTKTDRVRDCRATCARVRTAKTVSEVGALLLKALAAAREALYQQGRMRAGDVGPGDVSAEPPVHAETPTMAQQQADALALLVETALHHGVDPGAPGERYQVVVHVDAAVLVDAEAPGQSVLEGGVRVSAETSQRLEWGAPLA